MQYDERGERDIRSLLPTYIGRDHEPRNEAQEARKDKERGIFSLKKTYIGFHPVKSILDLGPPEM